MPDAFSEAPDFFPPRLWVTTTMRIIHLHPLPGALETPTWLSAPWGAQSLFLASVSAPWSCSFFSFNQTNNIGGRSNRNVLFFFFQEVSLTLPVSTFMLSYHHCHYHHHHHHHYRHHCHHCHHLLHYHRHHHHHYHYIITTTITTITSSPPPSSSPPPLSLPLHHHHHYITTTTIIATIIATTIVTTITSSPPLHHHHHHHRHHHHQHHPTIIIITISIRVILPRGIKQWKIWILFPALPVYQWGWPWVSH